MPRTPKVADEEILRTIALFEYPVITASDLAEQLDYSRDGVRNRLDELQAAGLVNSRDVGARAKVWWITDSGRGKL